MANLNELKPVGNITPFGKFCCTIGNLPASYMSSLTYEEQLLWLCDYLQNTVIPAVNTNAEAVAELQSLYIILKNYVDNYFNNLDVQQEINNKLDEMAENGQLQILLTTQYNDLKNEVNNQLNIQDNKINSLLGSNPIFVDSEENMTDNSKIYVLSSNNHIYQYSSVSEKFVDTGAIYSKETNILPIYKQIITASNYSSLLPDLNSALSDNIYNLLFASNSSEIPANLPVQPTGYLETLIVLSNNNNNIKQLYVSKHFIFTRYFLHGSWSSWQQNNNSGNSIITSNQQIEDLNNINIDGINLFLFSKDNENLPLNLPTPPTGKIEYLKTSIINENNKFQIYFSANSIFTRFKYNGNWNKWVNLNYKEFDVVNVNSYSDLLPDLNNATDSMYYSLLFAKNEINIPLNLPQPPNGKCEYLFVQKFSNNSVQIYFTDDNIYFRWFYGGEWCNWKKWNNNYNQIITIGNNKQFNTLKEGIEYSNNFNNATIYIDDGEYDLLTEFINSEGENFFENFSSSSKRGLYLSNNNHYIFGSKAIVKFNYSGNNDNVRSYFSPFNTGKNGFVLENLTLECSGCRYGIHDERGNSEDCYFNYYKNCNLLHDNTNGGFNQVIGGGLGKNGFIEIDGCIFSNPNLNNNQYAISYHNDNSSTSNNSKSNLIVKNNYFKNRNFSLIMVWYFNFNY